MAKKQTKTEEKKTLSLTELREAINRARKELFDLGMDKVQLKLKNTRSLFLKRKEIARMQTKLHEAEIYAKNV